MTIWLTRSANPRTPNVALSSFPRPIRYAGEGVEAIPGAGMDHLSERGMNASPAIAARPRLLELVQETIRRRHYSCRTEETYLQWIRRFIVFSGRRHPRELGAAEVTAFLNHLVAERHVAAATQNQALAALLFLYKEVLAQPLPWLDQIEHAKRPVRRPTVLTQSEARQLLAQQRGTKWLMASLLYGAGLRLRECLKLRVKDVDFGYRQILVRDGKGAKDRVTMLPGPAAASASGPGKGSARKGSRRRLWRCRAARCDRSQVSARPV